MEITLSVTPDEAIVLARSVIVMAKSPETQPPEMSFLLNLFNKIQIQVSASNEKK